jgi:hypothetical protein
VSLATTAGSSASFPLAVIRISCPTRPPGAGPNPDTLACRARGDGQRGRLAPRWHLPLSAWWAPALGGASRSAPMGAR